MNSNINSYGKHGNLTGKKFGKLTVIKPVKGKSRHICWSCLCSCGGKSVQRASDLVHGKVRSCGCSKRWHRK